MNKNRKSTDNSFYWFALFKKIFKRILKTEIAYNAHNM